MTIHRTVLLEELIEKLEIKEGETYFDATLGGGGHAKEILQRLGRKGRLIALDFNKEAVNEFRNYLRGEGFEERKEEVKYLIKGELRVYLEVNNFKNIDKVLKKNNIKNLNGVIADLGLSTDQIYGIEGVSYLGEMKLDMRLQEGLAYTASDLLNGLFKNELIELFTKLADIKFADKLANEIVKERKIRPFTTTTQLKHLIQKIVPLRERKGTNKNPEAKVFQALRIAVNDELSSLRAFLPLALGALVSGGRLAVISFHSGEDRIVKHFIKENLAQEKVRVIDKMVTPTKSEVLNNKRSESAKMRVIEKI